MGNLLNLYGIDPSVNTLTDPTNSSNIIVDKERIDSLIAEHFAKHFQETNRQLSDPSEQHTNFLVSSEEVSEIMKSVKTDKAMGWAAMPRQIGNFEDLELVDAVA